MPGRRALLAFMLMAGIGAWPGLAQAEVLPKGLTKPKANKADCPKPGYSPLHYWLPSVHRFVAYVVWPARGKYTFPEGRALPGSIAVIPFDCPAVDPAVLTMYYGAQPWKGSAADPK